MKWHIQQQSDHGTGNPIVARLALQIQDIIQFFPLTSNQKEEIFRIMLEGVMPHTMTCYKINKEISEEVVKCKEKINKEGIPTQSEGRVFTLPSILDINEKAETFLYNAKSALRDYVEIFNVIFVANIKTEARYDLVYKWARDKYGENDNLSKSIKQDHDLWIKRLVDMRNAVEHPGEHSGNLHIYNFRIMHIGDKQLIVEPAWHLNEDDASSIITDMETFIHNLLTFCEETLILCLQKLNNKFPIKVIEIPENERKAECPVRFRVIMEFKK